jgi:nitroreductase
MSNALQDPRDPLFENPTDLQRIFMLRRSYRKYSERPVELEKIMAIERSIRLFKEKMGYSNSDIRIIADDRGFSLVKDAATKGLIGSINPWLKSTKARCFIVAVVNNNGVSSISERNRRIAQTSMAMQVAILRATELGLATCWMAGINSREIERVLGLMEKEEVIAISTLGYPPQSTTITDYDFWANRLVSRRRKPLSEIVLNEESGYDLGHR